MSMLSGELMKHCDPEHIRLMESIIAEIPTGECERINEGEPEVSACWPCEFATVCDGKRKLLAYRKERGYE